MKCNTKIFLSLLMSIASLALFTSCSCSMACQKSALPQALDGTWKVVSVNGSKPEIETPMTLNFEIKDMHLGGKAICNSYGAAFTLTATGDMKIADIASTRVGCAGNTFENSFYAALQSVSNVRVKGKKAFLYQNKEDKTPIITLQR